jgi:hypothetical protein
MGKDINTHHYSKIDQSDNLAINKIANTYTRAFSDEGIAGED